MKNYNVLLKDDIYGYPTLLIIGDFEYYDSVLKKDMGCVGDVEQKYNLGLCSSFVFTPKSNPNAKYYRNIIWINTGVCDDFRSIISTLGHEVIHAVFNTFDIIKFTPTAENSEPFNYYFDYIYDQCMTEIMKTFKVEEIVSQIKVKAKKSIQKTKKNNNR